MGNQPQDATGKLGRRVRWWTRARRPTCYVPTYLRARGMWQ